MTRRIAIAVAVLAWLHLPALAAAYFSSIDDLPIPDALTEVADQGVVFDSPAGRIVTAVARGPMTAAAVRAYYRTALPPLGWTPRPGDSFVREDTTLTFEYSTDGGEVTVRVRMVPAGADGAAGTGGGK